MMLGKEEKALLRRECAELRAAISPEEKKAADERICTRFLALSSYRFADTVLLYAPIRSEINVWRIFDAALAAGKSVALPRCEGEKGEMHFYRVESREALQKGSYGVSEPKEGCPRLEKSEWNERTVCLLPGLSFDRKGYRLGYGGGYYDRYLRNFPGLKVGAIYRRLLREALPCGKLDLPVDIVLHEQGYILPGSEQ